MPPRTHRCWKSVSDGATATATSTPWPTSLDSRLDDGRGFIYGPAERPGMRRRALLLAVAAASGCTSVLPERPPPTPADGWGYPQQRHAFDRRPDGLAVTVAAGQPVEADDLGVVRLYQTGPVDGPDLDVPWVGGTDPRADPPLEPGDAITVQPVSREPVRIVYEAPTGSRSVALSTYEFPPQGSETP